MRLTQLAATAMAAAALLAGCGGGDATETGAAKAPAPEQIPFFYVNFQGKIGPHDAGLLLADRLGYFSRSKVQVVFSTPSHPTRPPRYLEEERVGAALASGPQLVVAREEGRPLIAFGSLIRQPTMAMIWLKDSGIDSVADLKGKTIAYPGVGFQELFLRAILERAGLTFADMNIETVGNHLESEMVNGRADALFGVSMNTEGRVLEARGLEPVATPVTKLGIPDYDELVLIARRDRYTEDPESFQRLLKATTRGNAAATERPGIAAKAVFKERGGIYPLPAIRAGVEELAPGFSRTGEIDQARMKRLIDWMYEEEMIKRKWSVSQLVRQSEAVDGGRR